MCHGAGWITPVRKERKGKFPFEKNALITLESFRGGNDEANSSDCRSDGFTNFDIKPWIAMSSFDNWDEQAVSPSGLADGDCQRYDHPSLPWEERLACDIFGNAFEIKVVSKSGHIDFQKIQNNYEYEETDEDWEENFSLDICGCYYCHLAEDWVKEMEYLIIKKEIEKQYAGVYYGACREKGIERKSFAGNNGDERFWRFDVEQLPSKLSKSHEIVAHCQVSNKDLRLCLRYGKRGTNDRYKNHRPRITVP